MLWDLGEGRQIASYAEANPQNEFGLDVISRITYCRQDKGNLNVLRGRIRECMNRIIAELCQNAEIRNKDIVKASVCGNTTMSHIFAGYSPDSLAVMPFRPAYTGILEMTAEEAGLTMRQGGTVTVLPNLAGHVGGDITAGLVASRLQECRELTFFIDIGTNGEIALTDGDRILVCSTAAGPAFEGASILCGMRAATGAIEKVIIEDGNVLFRTIGEAKPQGICGSGIIDAVAQMVKAGLIKKTGRMAGEADADSLGLSEEFKMRLPSDDKERQFIIAFGKNSEDIVITQKDIREVQLAKGAVAAGMALMLEKMGKSMSDIDNVLVAGAFGNYIDKENAMTIGLLPAIAGDKIKFIGNTAGAGVSMCLMNGNELETAKNLPDKVEHLELAKMSNFQETYIKAMNF